MQTLPKQERLRGGGVSRLFERGQRGATKTVIALALPKETVPEGAQDAENAQAAPRVAFIAGKKLGCSVLRNRMRRRLRAAYRLQKAALALPAGCELAFMAKKSVLEARWQDVMTDVKLASERALKAGSESCGRPPRGRSR